MYIDRQTKGDASETGLIKFAQPLSDLDKEREKYPVFKYTDSEKKAVDCMIPFSSEIKFNMFVRDMSKKENVPEH